MSYEKALIIFLAILAVVAAAFWGVPFLTRERPGGGPAGFEAGGPAARRGACGGGARPRPAAGPRAWGGTTPPEFRGTTASSVSAYALRGG